MWISTKQFQSIYGEAKQNKTKQNKKPQRANTVLKKSKAGKLIVLNFRTYYKATLIKIVLLAEKQMNKSMEENSPEIVNWFLAKEQNQHNGAKIDF